MGLQVTDMGLYYVSPMGNCLDVTPMGLQVTPVGLQVTAMGLHVIWGFNLLMGFQVTYNPVGLQVPSEGLQVSPMGLTVPIMGFKSPLGLANP